MSCCCDVQSGLGGLGAMLAAGSKVRLGFAYDIANYSGVADPSANDNPSYISEVIHSALLASADWDFASLNVSVTPSAYLGLQDGYILIQGTINRDKGSPGDIEDEAYWVIRNNLPALDITRRDPIIIDYVPPAYANNPTVAQRNTPADTTPRGSLTSSGSSWGSVSDMVNSLARTLGVDQTTALVIGAGGAVLGLILLKRLL